MRSFAKYSSELFATFSMTFKYGFAAAPSVSASAFASSYTDERRSAADERNFAASASSDGSRPARSVRPPPTARCVPHFSLRNSTKSFSVRPPVYASGSALASAPRPKNLSVG